jgi:dTDP-4-dehydrorhamnose 3,5-epimerase
MRLLRTAIAGVFRIELVPSVDPRGAFVRTVCRDFLQSQGLAGDFPQCSIVRNARRGVLRGLHFQAPPHAEAKLVQCLTGALYDVVVDLRAGSPTRGSHVALELRGDRAEVLYVPEGCAHGYQTLADDTLVYYHMSARHAPDAEGRVRYDDPRLQIAWPVAEPLLSAKDRDAPPYVW